MRNGCTFYERYCSLEPTVGLVQFLTIAGRDDNARSVPEELVRHGQTETS
jgi:hypothetical protein